MSDVVLPQEIEQVRHVLRAMALIERNRQIVDIGAYVAGTHPALDAALQLREPLRQFFTQASGGVPRHSALEELSRLSRIIE
jgi:flagellum-specific ATP synthase